MLSADRESRDPIVRAEEAPLTLRPPNQVLELGNMAKDAVDNLALGKLLFALLDILRGHTTLREINVPLQG